MQLICLNLITYAKGIYSNGKPTKMPSHVASICFMFLSNKIINIKFSAHNVFLK
jgi:hypothetical protein